MKRFVGWYVFVFSLTVYTAGLWFIFDAPAWLSFMTAFGVVFVVCGLTLVFSLYKLATLGDPIDRIRTWASGADWGVNTERLIVSSKKEHNNG